MSKQEIENVKIEAVKKVYVAWVNSDTTEGRGYNYPLSVSESKSAAIRKGHRKCVQGSDASVRESVAVRVNGVWMAPVHFERPTKEDEAEDKRTEARELALLKAKELGLSDEEIKALQ